MIHQEDRKEWYHNPVTQEFLQMLKSDEQDGMEAWAAEAFTGPTVEATAMANAKALGGMNMLRQVIDLVESFKGGEE